MFHPRNSNQFLWVGRVKGKNKFFMKKLNLYIRDSQTDQKIHKYNTDKNNKQEDHQVSSHGVQGCSILVDEVLVLQLSGHHHQALHHGRH